MVARLQVASNAVLVHPYDDFDIIRGQGTAGLEIADDCADLDMLLVPVGGGGLIAGVAVALKALRPQTAVIGVESELYPSFSAALEGVSAQCGGESLAEGIAVANAGALPVAIARRMVDGMILVSETSIEQAVAHFLQLQKTLAEGAGAAGLAALLTQPKRFRGRRVGLGSGPIKVLADSLND